MHFEVYNEPIVTLLMNGNFIMTASPDYLITSNAITFGSPDPLCCAISIK